MYTCAIVSPLQAKQSIHSHLGAIGRLSVNISNNCCYEITRGCCFASTIFLWRYKVISNTQINEQIRDKEVRLINEDGEMMGIMSSAEALRLADDAGLDLVKISPKAKPPVCKIIDYGKYRYEQSRKEKEAKKKQKTFELKEIRMSPNIDTNDLNTKMNAARKFLSKGNKVKVTLRFRGREMAHISESKHILYDFAEGLEDIAVVEKEPKQEGRMLSLVLAEKK